MKRSRRVVIRVLIAIALTALVVSAVYELLLPGQRIVQRNSSFGERVEMLLGSTAVLGDGWLSSVGNSDKYLEQAWSMDVPDEWQENRVSFYLVRDSQVVFWANHKYVDKGLGSLIVGGSDKVEHFDQSHVLIFTRRLGNLTATTVIELRDGNGVSNKAIFDNENVVVDNKPELLSETFTTHGKSVYVTLPVRERGNVLFSLLGWFGILGLLTALALHLSLVTTRRRSCLAVMAFFAFCAVLRLVLYHCDFPQGASFSWSSIGSVMVSQIMLLIFTTYLYSVRQKLAYHLRRMPRRAQWVVFLTCNLFVSGMIVYYHYAMVQMIYSSTIVVEIYNIFAMSLVGFQFYMICAIFSVWRVLFTLFSRVVFARFNVLTRSVVSLVMVTGFVVVFRSELHQTAILLIILHTLYVFLVSSRRQTAKVSAIFWTNIAVISLYVAFLTAGETAETKITQAQRYAHELAEGRSIGQVPYPDVTYAIISNNGVRVRQGDRIDMGRLMPLATKTAPEVLRLDGYVHVVEPRGGDVVVVSYPATTWLDILSLICYIFLGLFVVSGLLLYMGGVDAYDRRSNRTLANKIRFIVTGVVFFSMCVVAWIVYQYSERSDMVRQREVLNNTSLGMRESFSKYCRDNIDMTVDVAASADSILLGWYADRGSAFSGNIGLYNTRGRFVGGNDRTTTPALLYNKAYRSLSYYSTPYFDNSNLAEPSIYVAMFVGQTKLGYMEIRSLESPEGVAYGRYWLLGRIFNVFTILLLLSLVLSIVLYKLVAGPIQTLTQSLGGIGKLQKIPVHEGDKMQDEVGQLILQYNRMIDYLEESYAALARSEREGAWREMARQVAHEIKNPLTPMRLKIQMLQRARREGSENAEQQLDSTLVVLLEQIDVLSSIASDFSDLARLEQGGVVVPLELNSIIEKIVALYADNTKDVEISFVDRSSTPLTVMVSYVPLSRLMVNVLQNASQAIDCVGTITVTLYDNNGQAVIEILDTGHGIEPHLLERIFEPNFTTRSSGSGLGLAMCRQIVESFRGTISVTSIPDKGSVFTVTLPLAAAVTIGTR